MAGTKAIKWATAQTVVETDKATCLAINGDGRRQSINAKHSDAPGATRNWTGLSLRQLVFKLNANEKYTDLKNFKKDVANIFWPKPYKISDTEKVCIIKHQVGREGLHLIQT